MIPLRDNIPSSTTPVVNYLLIASCVVVFIAELSSPDHLQHYAFNPHHLISGRAIAQLGLGYILLTIFTSMFMHGGFMHIAFNMLFLYIFGDNVEDRMGHARYLAFYLLCGLIAALAHSVVSLFAAVPVLGASGAIAGVLGAYFVLFRGASVRALVPIFIVVTVMDIPAVIFLGLWFVYQLFSGLGTFGGGSQGVAFWAHIGGFLAGALLVRFFAVTPRRTVPRPRVLDVRYR
jgi:membrane associated rhomboid family serine protease